MNPVDSNPRSQYKLVLLCTYTHIYTHEYMYVHMYTYKHTDIDT